MLKWVVPPRLERHSNNSSSSADSGRGSLFRSESPTCAEAKFHAHRTTIVVNGIPPTGTEGDRHTHRTSTVVNGILSGDTNCDVLELFANKHYMVSRDTNRDVLELFAYKHHMEALYQNKSLSSEEQDQLVNAVITHFPFPLWPQEGLKQLLDQHSSSEAKILRTTMALTELLPYFSVIYDLENFKHHPLAEHTFGCSGDIFRFWELLTQNKLEGAKNWLQELEVNPFTSVASDYLNYLMRLQSSGILETYPAFDTFFKRLPYPSQTGYVEKQASFFKGATNKRLPTLFFAALAEQTIYNPARPVFKEVQEEVKMGLEELKNQGDILGTHFCVTTGSHFFAPPVFLSETDKDEAKALLNAPNNSFVPNDSFPTTNSLALMSSLEKLQTTVQKESQHRQSQQQLLRQAASRGFAPASYRLATAVTSEATLERQTESVNLLKKLKQKNTDITEYLLAFSANVSSWHHMMEAAKQGHTKACEALKGLFNRGQVPWEEGIFEEKDGLSFPGKLQQLFPKNQLDPVQMIQLDLEAYRPYTVTFEVLNTWCRMDAPDFDTTKCNLYPWLTFSVGSSHFLVMPESLEVAQEFLSPQKNHPDLEQDLRTACQIWQPAFFKAYPFLWGLTSDAFVPSKALPQKPKRSSSFMISRPKTLTGSESSKPLPPEPKVTSSSRFSTLPRSFSFKRKGNPVAMDPSTQPLPPKLCGESTLKTLKSRLSLRK